MSIFAISDFLTGKCLAASIAVLLFTYPALCDDKPKAPVKANAKSAPAAKPAGGGSATSKSPGPTTKSTTHAPTTANAPSTTGGRDKQPQPRANGMPAAKGHVTAPTKSGSVTKRADGTVAELHDTNRGMVVHHTLTGNRRVEVERPDHSRVVAERGGRGYVQGRPYAYRGHE